MTILLTQYQILRHADDYSLVKELGKSVPGSLFSAIWNESNGPLENILGLAHTGLMIFPSGITQLVFIIGSVLGLDGALLGRYIDKALGLRSLDDLTKLNPETAMKRLTGASEHTLESLVSDFRGSDISSFNSLFSKSANAASHTKLVSFAKGKGKSKKQKKEPPVSSQLNITPEEKEEQRRRTKEIVGRNWKHDRSFIDNYREIVQKPSKLMDMISAIAKTKFSGGLVAVAFIGLLKWAVSFAIGLVKTMWANKGKSALVLAMGFATYKFAQWFVGDNADESAVKRMAKDGGSIFDKKISNTLDKSMRFRNTLERMIDETMSS
jgi:hypothetical protein